MAAVESIMYHEDADISEIDVDWQAPAHHSSMRSESDTQYFMHVESEADSKYEVRKETPSGINQTTAEVALSYGDGEAHNQKKAAIAGALVARRNRSGDFLSDLNIDFYDDVNWEEIDLVRDAVEYEEMLEKGKWNVSSGEIRVDDETVASAKEVYGEIPGHQEIYDEAVTSRNIEDAWNEFGKSARDLARSIMTV